MPTQKLAPMPLCANEVYTQTFLETCVKGTGAHLAKQVPKDQLSKTQKVCAKKQLFFG